MGLWDRIKSIFGMESKPIPLPASPISATEVLLRASGGQPPAPLRFSAPEAEAPIILISGQSKDSKSVAAAVAMVRAQGGEPRIITSHTARSAAQDMKGASGLLLLGNDTDIDPAAYGQAKHPHTKSEAEAGEKPETLAQRQARTAYEKEALQLALERKVPMQLICGGMQRLNVMLGGTLHQHIPDLIGNDRHAQTEAPWVPVQSLELVPGTQLAALGKSIKNGLEGGMQHQIVPAPGAFGPENSTWMENSFHHQAIDQLGRGLRVTALYADTYTDTATQQPRRLIAAYEVDPAGPLAGQRISGVQWHPEFGASPLAPKIFADFVGAARERAFQPEILWSTRLRPPLAQTQAQVAFGR